MCSVATVVPLALLVPAAWSAARVPRLLLPLPPADTKNIEPSAVRCFGTEGRRKENQVPPSDQVFEYVVFKGEQLFILT